VVTIERGVGGINITLLCNIPFAAVSHIPTTELELPEQAARTIRIIHNIFFINTSYWELDFCYNGLMHFHFIPGGDLLQAQADSRQTPEGFVFLRHFCDKLYSLRTSRESGIGKRE
jgi:hypothetical protein